MKHIVSVLLFITVGTLLLGSCNSRGTSTFALSRTSGLADPKDWQPPVFPGASADFELQADMTAVAATPGALDQTACDCFGFPVHHAIFHAYRSDARPQEVMGFYTKQMAAQGWKIIDGQSSGSTLPQQTWQLGETGPMVAYMLVLPMKDGRTSIYISVAESDSPHSVMEK